MADLTLLVSLEPIFKDTGVKNSTDYLDAIGVVRFSVDFSLNKSIRFDGNSRR